LSNPRRFLILDNEGRLVKDFNWPEAILYDSRFAFDGKRLAYLTRDNHLNLSVVVVSILDGKGVEFPAEGSFGDLRGVVLPEGLDEAWVYSNTRVLKRYAIDRK
jgi:hypothetical protein